MHFPLYLATGILASLISIHVCAQGRLEKLETTFFVQRSSGGPAICGFEFTQSYRDRIYRQGAIVAVTDTLSWFETRGDIGVILKVFGSDFPRADNLEMTPKPFPVGKTFLIVDKTPYPVDACPCERPTGFCGSYRIPTSVAVFNAFGAAKLSIGFSRRGGIFDIVLPLDTRPDAATNPQDHTSFLRCISAIVARARANLKK